MSGILSRSSPLLVQPRSTRTAPLRIALFSGNYDCVRDGANRALNRLVDHLLHQAGAQVRIYSPTAPQKAFASVGDVVSVRSACIPGRPEYRLALGFTRAARADMEAFAPDIVHLSAPDILGRQAQKYARAAGIPVVASLHTRFETYLDYYRLGFLRRPVVDYLARFYGDSDHILAPTPPIRDEMASRFGDRKVSIWSRGVDRAMFHPALRSEALRARLGYKPDEIVPLFFGRLVLEKGLGLFAETIARLRSQGLAVRPMIVGDGPARDWIARRLPNATFMGLLEGSELGQAVASADLLINPSVTEAFGNVNLEAMASGLGVVSADVASASALIDHERTGLLVPARDAGAYAAAAARLIDEPARLRMLGRAASDAADRFRWNEILAEVARVYERVARRESVPALAKVA
ncbi:glycosyltransferase family 4 protein [Sphingopyxis granuli]